MTVVELTVVGVAAPQGSKTRTRFGLKEDNPNTKPWRGIVADDAAKAMAGAGLIQDPVRVTARFFFPRPKSHYRTGKYAHLLRDDAPFTVDKKPDLDKLQRAIGDALGGVVLREDSLIAQWVTSKWYGAPARVELRIETLDPLTGLPDSGAVSYL